MAPIHEVYLDFYGIRGQIRGSSENALEQLRRDFAYFIRPEVKEQPHNFSWTLQIEPKPSIPAALGWPILKTKSYSVYAHRGTRHIFYGDGSKASFDFKNRQGSIAAAQEERLHELAYLAILSRVGEALDRRGLHRIHALGIEQRGQGALIILPSGGGKSTLALEIFRLSPQTRFLSEDTPLVCAHGLIHPFPMRWSLRPQADLSDIPARLIRPFQRTGWGSKRLVDLEFFHDRLCNAVPLRWIFLGHRLDRMPADSSSASAWRTTQALAQSLIIGYGIPQMAEYMVGAELGMFSRLAPIALSRARTAWRLARQSRIFSLGLGRTPSEGARTLLYSLDKEQNGH